MPIGQCDRVLVYAWKMRHVDALLQCPVGFHLVKQIRVRIDDAWNAHAGLVLRDAPRVIVNPFQRDLFGWSATFTFTHKNSPFKQQNRRPAYKQSQKPA
jgi:hypothetical protein